MQHKLHAGAPAEAGAAEVYDEFVHLVRFLTAGERAHDNALSLAQHSLLGYIARNPGCRATDVSDVFGVNRSTVSRQLRSCVAAGWVEADSGPARLGHPLRLTPEGASVLAETVARRHDEVRTGLAGWGEDDIEQFTRLLRRFRRGVDPTTARTPGQNDGDFSA
jgi:DNA-binding MarR family transcriptional regulator